MRSLRTFKPTYGTRTEVEAPELEAPLAPAEAAPEVPAPAPSVSTGLRKLPRRPAWAKQRPGDEHLYRPLESFKEELQAKAEAPMSAPKPKFRVAKKPTA